MYESAIQAIASALSISLGIPARHTPDLSTDEVTATRNALYASSDRTVELEWDGQRFLAAVVDGFTEEVIVVGPYRREADPSAEILMLSAADEEKVRQALDAAAQGLQLVAEEPRLRLELSRQMELLSSAIVAISGELQLEAVLRRITDLARNFAAARYAALGIPDARGHMRTFITAGISAAEEARIGHRPEGLGLLGQLLHERRPIRLADLNTHEASIGFPDHHPPMKSFLGVPIIGRSGEIIGSLYLAEKRFASEFTLEDEMLIELLARHAAVAIENARLYRRLEEEEQRLTLILDQLPEAVMLTEPYPPRIVIMNQQARRLLEFDKDLPVSVDELGKALAMKNDAEQSIGIEQTPMLRSLVDGEVVVREALTVTAQSGNQRTFLVNSAPMRQHDEIAASICVFQDITEIRDADRLKDDFLSLVSHELRTPLTTIHGGAQLLHQHGDQLDKETRDELLLDINQESARLAALIQNMVQLAHIRAGRFALESEPVLIRALAERCVDQLRSLDPERAFRVDVGSDAVALADPDRVDEVLRNVIQNALKYTPAGTPIDITSRVSGERVEVAVRDYGPGIPEQEAPHVFERFERGSQVGSSTPGMGLGLYIVRLLVEAQGGDVSIELPEGAGAQVVFSLPRASTES